MISSKERLEILKIANERTSKFVKADYGQEDLDVLFNVIKQFDRYVSRGIFPDLIEIIKDESNETDVGVKTVKPEEPVLVKEEEPKKSSYPGEKLTLEQIIQLTAPFGRYAGPSDKGKVGLTKLLEENDIDVDPEKVHKFLMKVTDEYLNPKPKVIEPWHVSNNTLEKPRVHSSSNERLMNVYNETVAPKEVYEKGAFDQITITNPTTHVSAVSTPWGETKSTGFSAILPADHYVEKPFQYPQVAEYKQICLSAAYITLPSYSEQEVTVIDTGDASEQESLKALKKQRDKIRKEMHKKKMHSDKATKRKK